MNDTIKGLYLTSDEFAKAQNIYEDYLPLFALFSSQASPYLEFEPVLMAYSAFAKSKPNCHLRKLFFLKKDKLDLYYQRSEESVVLFEIKKWFSIHPPADLLVPDGHTTIDDAAIRLSVTPSEMFDWAIGCSNPTWWGPFLFVSEQAVKDAEADVLDYLDIYPLIDEIRAQHVKMGKTAAQKLIREAALTSQCPGICSGEKLIGLNKTKLFYRASSRNDILSFIKHVFDHEPLILLDQLKDITGYKYSALKDLVANHIIEAKVDGNTYLISAVEFRKISSVASNYAGIEASVDVALSGYGLSEFDYRFVGHREALHEYIISNNWWSIENWDATQFPEINAKNNRYFIHRKDVDLLARHIKLWIAGFHKTNREKTVLLIRHFEGSFPNTGKALMDYFSSDNKTGITVDDACAKNLVDFLFSVIPCEISDMDEDEIKENIILQLEEMPLNIKRTLATFLTDKGFTKRRYDFEGTGYKQDTTAYSFQNFSCMAYTVLNPESWEFNGLIAKAVADKKNADMWLFVALHFFAAWRTTDFVRIPNPQLNYPANEVLERIRTGTYPAEEAVRVTQYLMAQIQNSAFTPSKTTSSANSYIPELHIFIPTSCEETFGIILSIASAHFELDYSNDQFVLKRGNISDMRKFFGEEFTAACGYKFFSTRQANKALMQSVECNANNGKGPKPYLFAAIMRSHKGGYAKLPATTEIYLRDANFSGYTPEFILYQMFERGVCSFYTDALLKYSFGLDYQTLPVASQTDLIQRMGLQCYEISNIVDMTRKAQDEALTIVKSIIQTETHNPAKMLESILSGESVGKSSQSLCILMAAGMKCQVPERLCCMGCRFEIKTKALLSYFSDEYLRLQSESKMSDILVTPFEVMRRQYVMENELIPAMYEICLHLSQHTNSHEFNEYILLMRGVLDSGNAC